jgi:hypothetical protein
MLETMAGLVAATSPDRQCCGPGSAMLSSVGDDATVDGQGWYHSWVAVLLTGVDMLQTDPDRPFFDGSTYV